MHQPQLHEPERTLLTRLADRRSKRVVFLSHCLLNENTRYLGGASRRGCVEELVQRYIAQGVGIVQMPCPEQHAWGGVLKPHLLHVYGAARAHPVAWRVAERLVPLGLAYTRLVYRRLATKVAAEIADYVASGFTVVGIVGVDASPSCGVRTTIDPACVSELAALDPTTVSVPEHNLAIFRHARAGRGIFVEELQRALRRRGLDVPFRAHDMRAEIEAASSQIGAAQ